MFDEKDPSWHWGTGPSGCVSYSCVSLLWKTRRRVGEGGREGGTSMRAVHIHPTLTAVQKQSSIQSIAGGGEPVIGLTSPLQYY